MEEVAAPSRPPSRLLRALLAALFYSSVQWVAGCWRRALAWDALYLVGVLGLLDRSGWPLLLLRLASIVDAVLLTPARPRSPRDYLRGALVVGGAGLLMSATVRGLRVESYHIPSGAMIPTLLVGDRIDVDKTMRHPGRGEVAVFSMPNEPQKDLVKRVVAVGGDTIELRDNALVINDRPIARRPLAGPCEYDDFDEAGDRWIQRRCAAWEETLDGHTYRVFFEPEREAQPFKRLTVPPQHYFVLGDNRDSSSDSRYWGFVPQENIHGVVRAIWWSYGQERFRWERFGQPIR
jgi:signal peptidase I